MNKQEYLDRLNNHLQILSANERRDIIRDLEEHFYEAELRGKSETEIIAGLGSPEQMAETIIAEAKLKRIDQAQTAGQKLSATFGALIAIILLTPFNLIFVLIPFLITTFLLILAWKLVCLACVTLPFVGFAFIGGLFVTGLHFLSILGILFLIIGWVALVITLVYSLAYVTYLYFKGIVWLLKWNLQFIKNRMQG